MDRPPREIYPENDDPGRDRSSRSGPGIHQPITGKNVQRLNKDRQQAQAPGLPGLTLPESKEYKAKGPVAKPSPGSMTKEQRRALKEQLGRGEVAREPKRRER